MERAGVELRRLITIYAFEDEGSDQANATQAEAIYGLPELHRGQIAAARLVANPGCYATSIISFG